MGNCSKKQNRTNPIPKNKQGKGKNMPNAGKKSKTVGRPRKSHCNENEMVQHTVENQKNASHTAKNLNNASHTAENQINASHTGRNQIDASSKKNRTETEPCTSKKKRDQKDYSTNAPC